MLIDEATKKRAFGHYARNLVDVDLSKRIFEEVMVEREGYVFYIPVAYERLPEFYSNCYTTGHFVALCNKLHPKPKDDKAQISKTQREGGFFQAAHHHS